MHKPAGEVFFGWEISITCAGDEVQAVIAWLHVLPEVDVGVVEDVGVQVQVVESLGAENHAHIVTGIKQGDSAQEELLLCNLISIKHADLQTDPRSCEWV